MHRCCNSPRLSRKSSAMEGRNLIRPSSTVADDGVGGDVCTFDDVAVGPSGFERRDREGPLPGDVERQLVTPCATLSSALLFALVLRFSSTSVAAIPEHLDISPAFASRNAGPGDRRARQISASAAAPMEFVRQLDVGSASSEASSECAKTCGSDPEPDAVATGVRSATAILSSSIDNLHSTSSRSRQPSRSKPKSVHVR